MSDQNYKYSLDDLAGDAYAIETHTKELEEESPYAVPTAMKLDVDHREGQSYGDGFYNGAVGVSDNQYGAYIDKLFEVKYFIEKLESDERRSTELLSEVQKILTEKDAAHQRIFLSENENTVLNWRLEEEEYEWRLLKDRLTAKEEEKKCIKPVYGFPTVVLYIIVGFVFMAVDWAITKAYLELFFGNWEAWIMAIGISLLAFIIKPAIDRVFEKPYAQERRIVPNHMLLIIVSLITLTALGMIGYSRNEVVGKDKFLREMESETAEEGLWIEEDQVSPSAGENNSNSKLTIYQDFIQSPVTAAIFVLISIIFALAGAIIMAIGFPVAREHMQICRLRRQIKKIRKLLEKQFSHIETIRSSIAGNNIAKQYATYELDRMKDERSLVEQIEQLRTHRADLMAKLYTAVAGRETARYLEAYVRGKRHNLIGDLNIKVLGSQFLFGHRIENRNPFGPGRPPGSTNGSYGAHRSHGRGAYPREGYIHQQLRAIIDNNYIKNNAKS